MRYTNKHNLPEALVKAVQGHDHRHGTFSVTQLQKGATEIALGMVYGDKLEMDIADAVNMMLGTAVHKLFEEQETENVLNEHYMEATVFAGFTVSGTADSIDLATEQITDYKTCSTWKVLFKDFDDWRGQIKGYLWLWYNETGKLWHKGRIIAILKDWSATEAERDRNYPQSPVFPISFEYTDEEIFGVPEVWTEKIIEVCKKVASQDFGCCSEKERWAKPTKYALMRQGRKTALKLYDEEADCLEAVDSDRDNLYMEIREGEDTKCVKYCVAGKCGLCEYRNSKESGNG